MFCFKCGAEIPDESEFCFKCGSKIPHLNNEYSGATSSEKTIDNKQYPVIATGFYKRSFCKITIEDDKIIITQRHMVKTIVNEIMFDTIVDVRFLSSAGILNGYIFIVTENNLADYNLPRVDLSGNAYSLPFKSQEKEEFYCIFQMLQEIAEYNDKKYLIRNLQNTLTESTTAQQFYNVSDNNQYIEPKDKPLSKRQLKKENKRNAIACCPKCGSTSLSSNKKGFGIGKAVIGAALAGPIGLTVGNAGAKKVYVTCLNCGHRWKM